MTSTFLDDFLDVFRLKKKHFRDFNKIYIPYFFYRISESSRKEQKLHRRTRTSERRRAQCAKANKLFSCKVSEGSFGRKRKPDIVGATSTRKGKSYHECLQYSVELAYQDKNERRNKTIINRNHLNRKRFYMGWQKDLEMPETNARRNAKPTNQQMKQIDSLII